jgi:hypothetical protein
MGQAAGRYVDDAVRAAQAFYDRLPDGLSVADALAVPEPGERNLTLRKALGIRFPSDTVCHVTAGGEVQLVADQRGRVEALGRIVVAEAPGVWLSGISRRPDGRWVGTCWPI